MLETVVTYLYASSIARSLKASYSSRRDLFLQVKNGLVLGFNETVDQLLQLDFLRVHRTGIVYLCCS